MKFKKYETLKVNKPGSEYDGKLGKFMSVSINGTAMVDIGGKLLEFHEHELKGSHTILIVGQSYMCSSKVMRNADLRGPYTVLDVFEDGRLASVKRERDGRIFKFITRQETWVPYSSTDISGGCEHDWKLMISLHWDEYHCAKCKAKRPFDIYKDVA